MQNLSHLWLVVQVPGRPHYQEGVGVRTRRQKATLGSGITRHPTPLPSRLMHAAVQLLHAADEPPEAADGDWRSLLYGAQSDDSEDGDGQAGSMGGLSGEGAAIESLVRPCSYCSCAIPTVPPVKTQCNFSSESYRFACLLGMQSSCTVSSVPHVEVATARQAGIHMGILLFVCA